MIHRVLLTLLSFVLLSLPLEAKEQLYTCGMHPQIIKKEPGDCPICGMKLQPVREAGGQAQAGERKIRFYRSTMMPGEVSEKPGKDSMGMEMEPVYEEAATQASEIVIDSVTTQKMNLKTELVARGPVKRTLRAFGQIEFNERAYRDVTLRFEAWVEKLLVDANWEPVKKGQPLFEVYSPELYNASMNYLVARKGGGDKTLLGAAKTRLELFGVPSSYLEELEQAEEPPRTFVYRSPTDGVVVEKMVVPGQMMKAGERFFRLADLSEVWANAQLFEADLSGVSEGQTVRVRSAAGQGEETEARVERLLPQVQGETRTVVARALLKNPSGQWRPGMYVEMRFETQLFPSALLVPEEAVLRSGEKNTVFVALEGGHFQPRAVRLGARSGEGRYEVLDGLAEGERVVVSGQFMLDSESQLREAIQKMLRAGAAKTEPTEAQPSAHRHEASAHEAAALPTLYTCPMEEHYEVVEDKPGKCPECGMKLVPTSTVEHGKKSEAVWLERHAKAKTSVRS